MSELITMTELTDTELDAVSGGNDLVALNFGNIVTQVNLAEQNAAVVGNGSITQNLTSTGSNSISGNLSSTTSGFSFGGFTL